MVRRFLNEREEYIVRQGLDPAVWLPAANWDLSRPFYANSRALLDGTFESLRPLSQQFTGIPLVVDSARPDPWCAGEIARFKSALPTYMHVAPPLVLGEAGWDVEGILFNRDVVAYWERAALLWQAGFLDRDSPRFLKEGSRVLEIGGGYGGLAYHISRVARDIEYVIVDLPESLAYSAIYLTVVAPETKWVFLPNYRWRELVGHFDLVINTLSFSEMTEPQVRTYQAGLQELIAPNGFLFEQNQDCRHEGFLFAEQIVAEYFPCCVRLGGPTRQPMLQQGYGNVWGYQKISARDSPGLFPANQPSIVAEDTEINLVLFGGKYYEIPKSSGPVDFFQDRLPAAHILYHTVEKARAAGWSI
jgi:SAM-dependent methyltransferase